MSDVPERIWLKEEADKKITWRMSPDASGLDIEYARVRGEGEAISRESACDQIEHLTAKWEVDGDYGNKPEFSVRIEAANQICDLLRSLPSLPSQAEEMKQAMLNAAKEIESKYGRLSSGPAAQTNVYFASDQVRYKQIVQEVIEALQSVEVK